jgi:hypothetical protein
MKNFPGIFLNRDFAVALVYYRDNFPAHSSGFLRTLTSGQQVSRVLFISDWCASRDSAGRERAESAGHREFCGQFRPTIFREKFPGPAPE